MKKLIAVLISATIFNTSAHSFFDDYQKVGTETLSLPADNLRHFSIEAGAGSLTLIGHDNSVIEVTAEIYQEEKGSPYCLTLGSLSDNKAKLKANTCHNNNHTRINLAVYLPKQLLTEISDGSGPINSENTAIFSINDGSGEIVMTSNHADLEVNDGSGAIEIRQQYGGLTINDGSGGIDVNQVDGDVNISDGSGSIDVKNIAGRVMVSDGSGSINIDTAQAFELISDGSGSVSVVNVNSAK
ncbi:hypothetical protein LP316_07090 [Thalassotalea sp. LPB0316]|uniref:hypothetical protein n=1 Tax=Thalassotalea sp. LPB0316 TaxID=2769490 RepID=UPI00186612B6|nr:hypothetical protein [Thalassotalea sp. LPB0316]QOL27047.1 hypothetical protein LP316_07090 [Thalassotalea sp. LPB0316]